jgi:hypothetical protein
VNKCCCDHKRTSYQSRRSLIASSYQAPGRGCEGTCWPPLLKKCVADEIRPRVSRPERLAGVPHASLNWRVDEPSVSPLLDHPVPQRRVRLSPDRWSGFLKGESEGLGCCERRRGQHVSRLVVWRDDDSAQPDSTASEERPNERPVREGIVTRDCLCVFSPRAVCRHFHDCPDKPRPPRPDGRQLAIAAEALRFRPRCPWRYAR